jgi:hypothetical protein
MKSNQSSKKANKKTKKPKLKIDMHSWNTTDADEIARRKVRAELEKFAVENTNPNERYYSAFRISNSKDKQYCVEIRSLTALHNSCDCPDYRSNRLGTCKHIEHILLRLRKKGVRAYKQAANMDSPYTEIFLNPVDGMTIQMNKPIHTKSTIAARIDPFFDGEGQLIGDVAQAFETIENICSKEHSEYLRISKHITYFVDYQRIQSQKKHHKEIFLQDVKLGKRTMDVVKYPLLPYQHEGMLHLAFTERALLADEMGLGKTVQAIAASLLLKETKHIERVLVVTTASLKSEWEEQIAKFTDLPSLAIFGNRARRLKQYRQDTFFYLMNYEQVVYDHKEIQQILAPDVIILDEAQRIKNWQTKTANAIKELKSRYAFVLTGTPVENRIDDIYSIVQFLDPHIFGSLFRFNRDFYTLDENGKPIGYKNLDELYRRLRSIMLCRKKKDVEEELPQRINNNYFVSMDKEQRLRYEEYEALVARLTAKAKKTPLRKEEFEKLQQWLACMRMLCDTPYILDKKCEISPKLLELTQILEELLTDSTNKIIIFSEWTGMLELIKNKLEENNIDFSWHTGSVPQQKRREMIQQFKQDPNCRLFLSTDSGSVGLNLQVANVVINMDLPWNPAKLEQRIARAWRKNQMRPVQVINLVTENSIEHRMLYLLEQKQRLADGVLTGAEEIQEMQMPSGRAAFIERMEAMLGDVVDQDQETTEAEENNVVELSSTDKIISNVANALGSSFDLYHLNNEEQQTSNMLVIANGEIAEQAKDRITAQFSNDNVHIECIDRKTFETIQRLVDAGLLSFNPSATLSQQSAPENVIKLDKKQIEQAQNYLTQAERKQKMASLLIQGDFAEEAITPLKQAVESSIHAFASLKNIYCDQEPMDLSTSNVHETFIQPVLVEQHNMPERVTTLFSQLYVADDIDVQVLYDDHQHIINHIRTHFEDELINYLKTNMDNKEQIEGYEDVNG